MNGAVSVSGDWEFDGCHKSLVETGRDSAQRLGNTGFRVNDLKNGLGCHLA
jgi:hypothetical protein